MWVVGSLILLLILSIFLIRLPSVQNYLSQKAVNYLEDKLETKVSLDYIYIGFPKSIVVEGFYMEDRKQDTLIDMDYLEVDVHMWSLFSGDILINDVLLNGLNSHIYTQEDQTYNFNFIIEGFSGKENEKPQKSREKQRKFSIDRIDLKNINLDYYDETNGLDISLQLGSLFSEFKQFNPLQNIYSAKEFGIADSDVHVRQFQASPQVLSSNSESSDESPEITIAANRILLENSRVDYVSELNAQEFTADIGELNVLPRSFSLSEQNIEISHINLNESELQYLLYQSDTTDIKNLTAKSVKDNTEQKGNAWEISVQQFQGKNNLVAYEDHNQKKLEEGLDYAHMMWQGISLDIQNLYFQFPVINADINQFSANEKSGFSITQLETIIKLSQNKMLLDNFRFESPHSTLKTQTSLQFEGLDQIGQQPGKIELNSEWEKSSLGIQDLLYFQPDLKDVSVFRYPDKKIGIAGSVKGAVNDLTIPGLTLQYGSRTQMKVNGSITGLPDINATFFDLEFPSIRSTRNEWQQFLPPGTLPVNIELPANFTANASFKGTLENFNSSLNIETSSGNISSTASLNKSESDRFRYNLQAQLSDLQLGRIMKDTSTFGSTSLDLKIEGAEMTWPALSAELQANIEQIEVNNYNYRNISLQANIADQQLRYQGNIEDSSVIADFIGKSDLSQDQLFKVEGRVNIKGSDLYALKLVEEPLRAKGNISFDLTGLDPDSMQASISIKEGLLIDRNREYYMDSIYTYVNTLDSITELRIYSDIVKGELKGNVDPLTFSTVFRDQIEYYLAENEDSLQLASVRQQFDFQFQVVESPLLTELLLPSLGELKPGNISGSYDSRTHRLNLTANFPKIVYSGFQIDSLNADINSTRSAMNYAISTEKVSNENILVPNPSFSGRVEDGILDLSFSISDDTSQYIYWAGKLSRPDDLYRFQFHKDGFILNEEKWSVPEDHYLGFGDKTIITRNLTLSNGRRSVSVEKIEKEQIALRFQEFDLLDMAKAFQEKDTLLSGTLGGKIELNPQSTPLLFDADLDIAGFTFMESTLGTLSIEASNDPNGKYSLDAKISGNSNDASITGSFQSSESGLQMDLNAQIDRLQLQSLQGFTLGYVKNTSGYLSGNFDIEGQSSNPNILGQLTFHETKMGVSELNTSYQIDNESLRFRENRILFEEFTIQDSVGNDANISGYVSLQKLSNPSFRLDMRMNEFYLLSKKEEKGALFYGELILNSDLQIRGDLARPVISASARIIEGSEMVFVMPTEDPRLETSGGIDEFIDRDQEFHPIMEIKDRDDTVRSEITGIDLRATIKTDRNSQLKIYLDEGKGNFIQVKGDADLIFGMDPSGQMTLTGRYQVYDGQYQLLFRNVVKRIFQLQQGSSIVWTGNPLQARVDLTAIHTKYAEPLGLVQGQISEENQAVLNRYKQSYPFEVVLNMDEQLTSPSIDFDIRVAEGYEGAMGGELEAKLNRLNQNESELNKQVFALLVLGRFLPEDPFNVSGGGSVEETARRSVSKLLNAQLDKLSDKYIDAFELNLSLDSYEDYTTGEAEGRTELNIGINKAFFDDRLTVSVGGNVELEGSKSQQQKASDLIGDISVEYILTENGNWKLRAYRKNEYEGVIDGDIIKTGASLIFSKDYNTISDLFNSKNKD